MPKFSVYFYWLVSCILPIAALAQTTAKESGTAAVKITFSYGNNKDYAGQNTALKADLYKPSLFSSGLPVVILYHGGGYASGDRNVASLKVFSEYFTSQNISTILPDFRQGWYESSSKPLCESVTAEKFEDAALRAYQDNRALIRYCKANAGALGIDSNKIFLFGISSGGFWCCIISIFPMPPLAATGCSD